MPVLDQKNPFNRLVLVYALWVASSILSGGLFEIYLSGNGIPQKDIFFTNILWYLPPLLLLPFIKGFKVRQSVMIGVAFILFATILLLFVPTTFSGYLYRFVLGFTIFFFWLPFNTLYYEFSKGNHAQLSALYYAMSPALTLILPLLSGYVASLFGFSALFILAIIVILFTLLAAHRLLEDKAYGFDLAASLKSINGLKSILFLEGFTASLIIGSTIPIILLDFAASPFEFGLMTSLATVFSLIAMAVTAKMSDDCRQRRKFLLPVTAGFAIATIFASTVKDAVVFIFAMGMVRFFSSIFFPLPLALVMDNSKSTVDSMAGREFMLNIGRVCGVAAGIIAIFMIDMRAVLLIEGLALLLYIPVFENRKKKLSSC